MLSRLEIATNDNLEAHCQIYDKLEDLENELSEGADDSAEHTMGGEAL
jgi:hypothetical protein